MPILTQAEKDSIGNKLDKTAKASEADVVAGTDDTKFVTAKALKQPLLDASDSSASGLFQFQYRVSTTAASTATAKHVSFNHVGTTPNEIYKSTTMLYIHKKDKGSNDMSLFLDALDKGDYFNIHDNNNVNQFVAFDINGKPVKNGNVYEVPVIWYAEAGAFTDDEIVNIHWNQHDAMSSDLATLSDEIGDLTPFVAGSSLVSKLFELKRQVEKNTHTSGTTGTAPVSAGIIPVYSEAAFEYIDVQSFIQNPANPGKDISDGTSHYVTVAISSGKTLNSNSTWCWTKEQVPARMYTNAAKSQAVSPMELHAWINAVALVKVKKTGADWFVEDVYIPAGANTHSRALLEDGSIPMDPAYTPSNDGDVVTKKFLNKSYTGAMRDKGTITDIDDITEIGVYYGGKTVPNDHSQNEDVANSPIGGAVMVMASVDDKGNFGYFLMGSDMTLHTGAKPDGGTYSWVASGSATGETVKLDNYVKPSSPGSINEVDSVNIAIGKLEKGLEDATAGGGDVNVQSDWAEGDNANDSYIKNKPTIPTVDVDKNYVDAQDAKKASKVERPTKTSPTSITYLGTELTIASPVAGTDYYFNESGIQTVKDASTLGGFHYGLTPHAEAPTGNKTEADMVKIRGINAHSIWTKSFRPTCSPEGMVYINGRWYDIYLLNSEHIVNGTSKAGTTIAAGVADANGRAIPKIPLAYGGDGTVNYGKFTWFQACEVVASHKKTLISYAEFPSIAYGVTEMKSSLTDAYETVSGKVEHYPNLTSKFGIEQATGVQWTWGKDVGGNRDEASVTWDWRENLTDNRGDIYALHDNHVTAVLLGANRDVGVRAGSRSSNWGNYVWYSDWFFGCRAACNHLELI